MNYSQKYLAKKLGMQQKQYSYLETKLQTIPEETLNKIAEILEVTVEFIEQFNPHQIVNNNTFNNSSKGFFQVERIVIQTKENVDKVLETIERLSKKIEDLERKLNL